MKWQEAREVYGWEEQSRQHKEYTQLIEQLGRAELNDLRVEWRRRVLEEETDAMQPSERRGRGRPKKGTKKKRDGVDVICHPARGRSAGVGDGSMGE